MAPSSFTSIRGSRARARTATSTHPSVPGQRHRLPGRIDQSRHQQRALEHGPVLQGVRGQLHQRRRRSSATTSRIRKISRASSPGWCSTPRSRSGRTTRSSARIIRRRGSTSHRRLRVRVSRSRPPRAPASSEAGAGTAGRAAGRRSRGRATAGAAQLGRRRAVAAQAPPPQRIRHFRIRAASSRS